MIQDLTPALFLLTAALVVFGSMNLARRLGLSEAVGCGVALCIIAISTGMSPATWRAAWEGGPSGDRLLTYARIVGISGVVFLAGTRFNFVEIRRRNALMFRTIVAAIALFVIVLFAAKLLVMDLAQTILLMASVIASSLWFPTEFRGSAKNQDLQINWQTMAVTFTACAFLIVYFVDVLSIAARASLSVNAIMALYEAVKLFVLFGFAYFICSRFLERATGRISGTRTTVGFVLIAVLIFGLVVISTNQLGAIAWAFIAGGLWQRSELGKEFGKEERPIAVALLMALAFIPLILQAHGRPLGNWLPLLVLLAFAIAIKVICSWLLPARSIRRKTQMAISLSFSGEVGIVFLGFAITRWTIPGPPYFLILGYALIATVLVPLTWSASTARLRSKHRERENKMKIRVDSHMVVASMLFGLLLAVPANAQEFTYAVQQDRTIGHRDGELIISEKFIEYRARKRDSENRRWTYSNDIKLLEILSPTKIRIWTYKDRKLFLGKNESLTFELVGGRIDQHVSNFLRARLKRPFVTSFIEEEGTAFAEIPAKHSHRFGGCEGTLKVYSDRLVYESLTGHDSRTWRWTDLRSVGRSDQYHFEVQTFEPETGASSRSFNFVLKQQMTDKTYDLIWSRVYRPTPLIRVAATNVER